MPRLNVRITKVWRHANEHGRIHYIIERVGDVERHLYTDEGTALYDVLAEHLDAIGYRAPASALVPS